MKYLTIDKRQRVKVNNDANIPSASLRLIDELNKKGIENDFCYNDELEFLFYNNGKVIIKANGKDITQYTHIIFRGHSLDDSKEYEYKRFIIDHIDKYNTVNPNKKILVQNSEAIKRLPYYNKIAIAMLCNQNNLPYFTTYYRTDGNYKEKRDILNNYPLIIKEYTGANRVAIIDGEEKIKKNVYKLDKEEDYTQEGLKDQNLKNFFIQEFSDAGCDYRIFVKLGKVIGGWKRTASQGFMTVSKGIYEIYNEPNKEIKEISEKVAKILDADFIAVDFMYIKDKPYIQELGFHPGFLAYENKAEKGTPTNIAEAIVSAFRDN